MPTSNVQVPLTNPDEATWIDPNAPLSARKAEGGRDEAAAAAAAARAKGQIFPNMPEGQMVGRFYVPPAATQQLSAALRPTLGKPVLSGELPRRGEARRGVHERRGRAAAEAHMRTQPRNTAPNEMDPRAVRSRRKCGRGGRSAVSRSRP